MSGNDYNKSKENVRRSISPEPFKPGSYSYPPERKHSIKEAWEIRPKSTQNSPRKDMVEPESPKTQPSSPLDSPSKTTTRRKKKEEKPKHPGPEADGEGVEETPTAGGIPWYEEPFYDIAYGRHPGPSSSFSDYYHV
ncbi:hypothetical protein AA313_de0205879 [Arthrobotrys entomopaga]|nr:hypothetical protein AA313_de0205879 [Arthrobotrys entomopaga]